MPLEIMFLTLFDTLALKVMFCMYQSSLCPHGIPVYFLFYPTPEKGTQHWPTLRRACIFWLSWVMVMPWLLYVGTKPPCSTQAFWSTVNMFFFIPG